MGSYCNKQYQKNTVGELSQNQTKIPAIVSQRIHLQA